MLKRILLTGQNSTMINDYLKHQTSTYKLKRSAPSKEALLSSLKAFRPHVIIISLKCSVKEDVEVFQVFKDYAEYEDIPIIIVGNEEDCSVFNHCIWSKTTHTLLRPFNIKALTALLEKVCAYVDEPNYVEAPLPVPIIKEKSVPKPIIRNHYGKYRILVVDDDPRMLRAIKLQLENIYEVTLVTNGQNALQYLTLHEVDLILLDYIMPNEDGPTVLKAIRSIPAFQDIPAIFLTGVSDKDKVKKGLELAPQGYLLKPVSHGALLEKISTTLRQTLL